MRNTNEISSIYSENLLFMLRLTGEKIDFIQLVNKDSHDASVETRVSRITLDLLQIGKKRRIIFGRAYVFQVITEFSTLRLFLLNKTKRF